MKNIKIQTIIWLLMMCSTGVFSSEKKLAQSGFQFLSVVSDAKASAMAEAMTSLSLGSSALFFNPAGMANMNQMVDITASHNQWIADIDHSTLSLALRPAKGQYGVFGFSIQTVNYGDFYGTRLDPDPSNKRSYIDTDVFTLDATAIGVGYAKQLTDRFCIGAQVRWIEQDLGESVVPVSVVIDSLGNSTIDETEKITTDMSPLAFDFGTQYKPGFHSLVFGMSVRNFSKELEYAEEGFQMPLVFNLGISMNVFDIMENKPESQSLFVAIDACHYRSHPEQIKIGLDYCLMSRLSLRCGYISNNDENGLSYGIGAMYSGLAVDYSYTPFGIFDSVTRMTARFSF